MANIDISYCKINVINASMFAASITAISDVLDEHAPVRTRSVPLCTCH